ncbi:MAG: helix-turn-helix domain-containing protein, partial [Bacteroidales bacterium]
MNENRQTTEKEIITIAKKVFLEKGYMGATMRDIAQEAHINLAMLNYYFGSKDKLFDIIFEET